MKIAFWRVGVVYHLTENVLLDNDIAQEFGPQSHVMFTTRVQAKKQLEENKRINENVETTKVRSKSLFVIENEDEVLEGLFKEDVYQPRTEEN